MQKHHSARSPTPSTDDSCCDILAAQCSHLFTPLGLFRLTFRALTKKLRDLCAIGSKQFEASDETVFGRFTCDPAFSDRAFDQVQGKAGVENIDPLTVGANAVDFPSENLHAAGIADENHDLILIFARGCKNSCQ